MENSSTSRDHQYIHRVLVINPSWLVFIKEPNLHIGDFIGYCKNHNTTCTVTCLIYNIIFSNKKMIIFLYTSNHLLLPGPPIYKTRPKHMATPEIYLLWSTFDTHYAIEVLICTINEDPQRDCPVRGPTDEE